MNTGKNVVNNQQPQPQKEEKKKNKVVAWWLGLGKWAKVGLCASTAAVLATTITLPIVLTKSNSESEYIPFIIPDDTKKSRWINVNDYPTQIKKTDTSFTYKIKKPEAGLTCVLLFNENEMQNKIPNSEYTISTETTVTVSNLNLKNYTKIYLYMSLGK